MTDLALKFFSPADSERASRAPFLVPQAVKASVIAKKKNPKNYHPGFSGLKNIMKLKH